MSTADDNGPRRRSSFRHTALSRFKDTCCDPFAPLREATDLLGDVHPEPELGISGQSKAVKSVWMEMWSQFLLTPLVVIKYFILSVPFLVVVTLLSAFPPAGGKDSTHVSAMVNTIIEVTIYNLVTYIALNAAMNPKMVTSHPLNAWLLVKS